MLTSRFFENYTKGKIRKTTGRTITEADIVLHAGQTGDFYPHHVDVRWCIIISSLCNSQPFHECEQKQVLSTQSD